MSDKPCFSCASVLRDSNTNLFSVIVAGGVDEAGVPLTQVEVLDPGATEWRPGLDLPLGIKYSRMIEEQDGGVVLAGGDAGGETLGTLYLLPNANLSVG